MTLKKAVVNCTTGEVEEIELTDKEIAKLEADAIAYAEQKAKEEAEAQAKAEAKISALAKLAALGLTEEETNALIS